MERKRIVRHIIDEWEQKVVIKTLEIRWPNVDFEIADGCIYANIDYDPESMRAYAMGAWNAVVLSQSNV